MGKKILIVSNNDEVTLKIKAVSEFLGKDVAITEDVESAKSIALENHTIGLCLISHDESDTEEELVTFFQSYYSGIPVYLVRTDENPEVRCKASGIETLKFPTDHNKILQIIGMSEGTTPPREMPDETRVRLTGESPEISRVRDLVNHVSNTDANVLLLGESGTGKEVVARSVHALSSRRNKPFIAVNCAAIPADLLESELFGYEKGAFTGATTTRRGRFELAEGGTLFLDEIGDMPLPMQVKLLRVIQERSFERVGGTKSMNCDVRLIAATHQNLERCIEQGKFRMDLFYRLNVFPIDIPPLRKRIGDIPVLLREFAEKARRALGHLDAIQFDEAVTMALCDHPLPGNVRELQNLVERLAILYPEELISLDKLPERYQGIRSIPDNNFDPMPAAITDSKMESELLSGKFDLKDYLTTLEKNLIYQALNNTNWVVTQAAESLCLRRTTLIQKIRRLNIENKSKQNLSMGM
ncbi:MAG: sigma-54 dependent transcriptional regulator [Pseudomonadales bacterium]|nr:sigma-54 dependent transcriptional regulator [Pseudomonadales bacterium]